MAEQMETQTLYAAVPTDYARQVIDEGILGRDMVTEDEDGDSGMVVVICEFRSRPPTGLTRSLTAEVQSAWTCSTGEGVIIARGMLADEVGDFLLTIEVPRSLAVERTVTEDPPQGWPFQEIWLDPEEANQYRNTLKVFNFDSGDEVRPDLVGK